MIEVDPQAAAVGQLPGNVRLWVGRRIDAASAPELGHRRRRDGPRMQLDDLALMADARSFAGDEKHVGGRSGEGVLDELLEGGEHGKRVVASLSPSAACASS